MRFKFLFILNEILTLLGVIFAGVSLDFTNVTSPQNIQALEEFTVMAFLAHPSTTTFTLKLNPRAMLGMSHLISNNGGRLENITDVNTDLLLSNATSQPAPVFPALSDAELRQRVPGLSKEAFEVLKAIFSGHFSGPISLAPTDSEFQDAIKIMYALRTGWNPKHNVPDPQIETLGHWSFPNEIEDRLSELTKEEDVSGRVFYSPASPLHVATEHIQHMMSTVFSIPRNHESSPKEKLSAMLYLTKKFDSYGLMVVDHLFSAAEYFFWFDQQLQGMNIVGVLAGSNWGSSKDRPIIIGAHLDTVADTPGLNDNGSGLAVLVEAARVLAASGCQFKHSIFFVAFDLEEIGTQGSLMFVKDYLVRSIIKEFDIKDVTGAFIIDCISNWDPKAGTQDFPIEWAAYLPDANVSIAEHNFTGDFAAVLYRKQVDHRLASVLSRFYRGLGHNQYRLELMGLEELGNEMPNVTTLASHFDFIRSDHVRFWYLNDTSYQKTIPAVLITDMGPYRGYMRECYHKPCDSLKEGLQDVGLVAKVTQAVVWAVADLAEGKCGPRGRLSIPTLFTLMGSTDRQNPDEGMPLASVQTAMEILHFLGLLPSLSAQGAS